jgi:hypothetical protein
MNSNREPRIVSKIKQRVKRMRIDQESPAQSMKKKECNTHISPLPSWGRIKWLEAEGEVTSSFLAIFDT